MSSTIRDRGASAAARGLLALFVGAWVVLPLALLVHGAAAPVVDVPTAIDGTAWARTVARTIALAALVVTGSCAGAYAVARTVPTPVLLALALLSPLARALGVLELGLSPGFTAIALAQLGGALPLAALLVQLRLASLDPRWLEAAADLGAGAWTRWRRVTLPLVGPALALAGLWSALLCVGDVVTLELAGGGLFYTVTFLVRDAVLGAPNPTRLLWFSALSVGLSLSCAYVLLRALVRLRARDTQLAARARRASPALRVVGWSALTLAAAPFLGLVSSLTFGFFAGDGADLSLASSHALLWALVPVTAALSLAVTTIGTLAGFGAALLRPRLSPVWGALLLTPLALPPIVQGALALALGRALALPPGPALTLWGLLPAGLAAAFVGALLAVSALPRDLEDSARDLGADARARLRWLWAPLLARPALAVSLIVLALTLAAVDVPAFTSGPGGSTLSVGMTILARGRGSAAVGRWSLALALAPALAVGLSLCLTRGWRARA